MNRTIVAWACAALIGPAAVVIPVAAGSPGRVPAQTAPEVQTLQRDADRLLKLGAPGVLAELRTPAGQSAVHSGFADVAARTPVPLDARFRIGSFTKPFVSATLVALVGEGRLALDDTIERWLPGVVTGNGNDGTTITIRQVLQHTGGVPEYVGDLPLFTEQDFRQHRFDTVTAEQAVALAMTHPPTFAPGTSWSYSNTDYALAGMVIAKVTGRAWQDEVQRCVLDRLGLRDTFLPRTDPTIPGPHAVGYERFPGPGATPENPDFGEPIDATELNPSFGGAAGEIISTTGDALTFLHALVGGQLVAPALLAEMQTTVPVTGGFGAAFPGARYGLGLLFVPTACGGYWGHGGDIQGFYTRNGITPDGTRSVVVSVNTDTFSPEPGETSPTTDPSLDLVEHALCGSGR